MEFKGGGYLVTMTALATAGFGVVAALAWNTAITDIFKQIFGPATGVWAELLYAALVTIVAVIVIQNLAKLGERDKTGIK